MELDCFVQLLIRGLRRQEARPEWVRHLEGATPGGAFLTTKAACASLSTSSSASKPQQPRDPTETRARSQ